MTRTPFIIKILHLHYIYLRLICKQILSFLADRNRLTVSGQTCVRYLELISEKFSKKEQIY